jgi:hypothetical protein
MVEGPKKPFRGPLSKKVAIMPIMRGDLGDSSDQWNVAGSGRKIQKMRQWIREDMVPGNWKDSLRTQFVKFVEITEFLFYVCPICSKHI